MNLNAERFPAEDALIPPLRRVVVVRFEDFSDVNVTGSGKSVLDNAFAHNPRHCISKIS
jgi:hypothetical protein